MVILYIVSGLITLLVVFLIVALFAVAGADRVREAYAEAVREGYLWHEFGDSHLILPRAA